MNRRTLMLATSCLLLAPLVIGGNSESSPGARGAFGRSSALTADASIPAEVQVRHATPAEARAKDSKAYGLDLTGPMTYQISGQSVRITVAQIRNSNSTTSDPLQLELWATPSVPQFGSSIDPSVLASHSLGTLPSDGVINNVDTGYIPLSRPPDGTYFITLALEYSYLGNWYYTSLYTFPAKYVFGPCSPDSETLCLANARFRVRANWTTTSNGSGTGKAISLSSDTGYFWFFNSSNVELVVKVLDGRSVNGMYWVFYGALSNVAYTIDVTDMLTGASRTYANPNGNLASVADTTAFPPTGAQPTPTQIRPTPTQPPPPNPTPTSPASLNLTGNWYGSISSPSASFCNAAISVYLAQSGGNVTGNFSLPGNSSGSFQGTLTGNQLNGVFNTVAPDGCAGSGVATGSATSNHITVSAPSITSANPLCSFCQENVIQLSR